jgi:hypothetical protein
MSVSEGASEREFAHMYQVASSNNKYQVMTVTMTRHDIGIQVVHFTV